MDLPVEKVQALHEYTIEKKWTLVCDQVGDVFRCCNIGGVFVFLCSCLVSCVGLLSALLARLKSDVWNGLVEGVMVTKRDAGFWGFWGNKRDELVVKRLTQTDMRRVR